MREQIEDDAVDLTVTSPPYDNLRTYNGYSFDFEGIAQELYRITKPGGVVVWVVGDATIKGSETGTSFRQALYFMECGFNLHDTMIYEKVGGLKHHPRIPRYSQDFEYMFILTKGTPKTFNMLREPCKNAGEKLGDSKKQREINGELRPITKTHDAVQVTKRRGNIWRYGVGYNKTTRDRYAFGHPALFPEKLAEEHIISWSNPGDTVLDIFGGSGTTAKMALLNDRNFIHLDLSEEYCEIASRRINDALKAKMVEA